MRIGFDGKRAANNLTGLGNYSRSLIVQLSQFFPQNQYLVYTPKVKDHDQIGHFLEHKNIEVKLPEQGKFLWRTFGIKRQIIRDKVHLFHGLSHEIPIGIRQTGIPSIVTIHDLIFLRFPQYFGRIDRWIYTFKCRYACKNADRIIAISECTKRDIVAFFNTPPEKIDVVYQSCDDSFKIPADISSKAIVKEKYGLPDQFILSVGTIETRKNLVTLIRALKDVNQNYHLVVIGKKTPYMKQVEHELDQHNLRHRVTFLSNIPFQDLPLIYQLASVFVYPSVYEGFGIPIIEALYSGVPVVAATGSCLEEAGGPGSIYVAPYDDQALCKAINKVLDDPALSIEMKKRGLQYAQRFNNDVVNTEMMNVYQSLLSDQKK